MVKGLVVVVTVTTSLVHRLERGGGKLGGRNGHDVNWLGQDTPFIGLRWLGGVRSGWDLIGSEWIVLISSV
jgi:hypothetical protein